MEGTVVVSVSDPELVHRVEVMVASGVKVVACDVRELVDPDSGALDVVLRLALVARRCGGRVRLVGASPAMRDLLVFLGLAGILGVSGSDRPAE